MKNLRSYIVKYWYAYAFATFFMVISISLDMLSPQITKFIIDDVIIGGNMSLLPKLLFGILMIGVGRCIFQYLKEITFDLTSTKIALEIRQTLFNHIQSLSIQFFDKTNTGELMTRIKDDVDNIWRLMGFVGMLIIEVIIHTSITLYCMFQINSKLAIVPFIAIPLVAIISIFMEKKLGEVYGEISEENAVLNTVAEENLAGVRTVKAFAREKHEIKKFLSHNNKYYELNMKQSKVFILYYPYFQLITKFLPIIIIIWGGILVINNEMTLGELGAFTEYSANIVWPMEMLGWLTNDISSALASNKKIKKIYDEKPIITDSANAKVIGAVKGDIEFNQVSFSLANKVILKDISFRLEAGKTLGIMGATGSGKTSLINLLHRFYNVDEGQITLDGFNIEDLTLKELRSSISLVMQDVFLFSDTINENIKLGNKASIKNSTILESVHKAQAKVFIETMDKQYETIIGERGVGLSGGQKQRISIARALAKETPVLVFDDSTSSLDMETEFLIQQALNSLTNTSKIIIGHRISAVKNADEILILDDGCIKERGTHEELLNHKGLYYQTYMAQYGEFDHSMFSN